MLRDSLQEIFGQAAMRLQLVLPPSQGRLRARLFEFGLVREEAPLPDGGTISFAAKTRISNLPSVILATASSSKSQGGLLGGLRPGGSLLVVGLDGGPIEIGSTVEEPETLGMRWQKTEGSALIDYLEGSTDLVSLRGRGSSRRSASSGRAPSSERSTVVLPPPGPPVRAMRKQPSWWRRARRVTRKLWRPQAIIIMRSDKPSAVLRN